MHRLQEVQAEIRTQLLEQIVATSPNKQVLFETDGNGYSVGHTPEFIEVTVKTDKPLCGTTHTVRLNGLDKVGCTAELVD